MRFFQTFEFQGIALCRTNSNTYGGSCKESSQNPRKKIPNRTSLSVTLALPLGSCAAGLSESIPSADWLFLEKCLPRSLKLCDLSTPELITPTGESFYASCWKFWWELIEPVYLSEHSLRSQLAAFGPHVHPWSCEQFLERVGGLVLSQLCRLTPGAASYYLHCRALSHLRAETLRAQVSCSPWHTVWCFVNILFFFSFALLLEDTILQKGPRSLHLSYLFNCH